MRIGIDLDDTLCDTASQKLLYEKKYVKEKNIDVEKLWSDDQYKSDFLDKYLKPIYENAAIKENAYSVLNTLKESGNELYIVTARSNRYIDDVYTLIVKYLKKENIVVDKVIYDAHDKVDACINYKVDIMIDNSKYNFDMLCLNNIRAILYDENFEYLYEKNRVSNWNEVIPKIEEMNSRG